MNLQEFTDQWITKNVDTSDIYGERIESSIRDFVAMLVRQEYSEIAFGYFLESLMDFIVDYQNDRMS